MELSIQSVVEHLQRKEYIEAMKETGCGWEASKSERFKQVGCPNDLYYVFDSDMPHPKHCIMDCEDCWKYVLKNKWK